MVTFENATGLLGDEVHRSARLPGAPQRREGAPASR
jgi:hypothetical protein